MSNKTPASPVIEEFNQKGIVHIENFLSDVEFSHVTEYFYTTVKNFFKDGGKGTINPDFILGNTNPLLSLFKACARVNEFSDDAVDGYPRTEFWHHKHFIKEIDGGVLMEDVIHYKISFGPIGVLLNFLFINSKLNNVFKYRELELIKNFGNFK